MNNKNVEILEKELIREFFKDMEGGLFVEVGANEPDMILSQTFHLEENLNWNGILVEPIDYLCEKLREKRLGSKTFQVACTSPIKVGKAILRIPIDEEIEITGHACLEVNVDHSLLHETRDVEVATTTLNVILDEEGIKKVNFLSIDVEGTELDVLKGFDIQKFAPELIIVEDRLVFLSKHNYLKRFGYQIFRRTGFNNWYTRKDKLPEIAFLVRMNLFRKIYLSSWIKRIRETLRMRTIKTFTQI